MPKFKVTATLDVGFEAIIEADDTSEAWLIASKEEGADWEKTDDGHDWTLENIWEVEDDEVSQVECKQGEMGAGKDKLLSTCDTIEYPCEPVQVQKHKANPPRNPFASETQNIKGHKSRKMQAKITKHERRTT
jgi:hypothetical protein